MSGVDSPSALEALSSDYSLSPSPPPQPRNKHTKTSSNAARSAGLDSSSELSELTEDEQEGATRSTASIASTSAVKKKRGSIVPAPMWEWAYKPKKQVDNDDNKESPVQQSDEDGTAPGEPSTAPQDDTIEKPAVDGVVSEKENVVLNGTTPLETEEGGDPPQQGKPTTTATPNEDSHDEDDDDDVALVPRPKTVNREGSTELTDYEDPEVTDDDESALSSAHEDEGDVELESESESDTRTVSDNEPDEQPPPDPPEDVAEPDPDEELTEEAPVAVVDPVVPAAPAGSSIMAGQQLIKTPTPSPSPSPEPEDVPAPDADVPEAEPEPDAEPEVEAEPEPEVEIDPTEAGEAEVEAEVEQDETELDLQPAHRAEALDVLAQIELRYALLRERLYIEKMEDLAMEEAMVLQGIHPEMIHLLNELQVRHDRRLELAAKKRRYEDEHVTLMRKVEEDIIWNWWKFERDDLQTEMYSELNRKRRKLEREKRLIERPLPARRIPALPPIYQARPISLRDMLKNPSLESAIARTRPSRKRKTEPPPPHTVAYPQLHTLTPHEISNDLQIIGNTRRAPTLYNQQPLHPLDVGMGVPPGGATGGMGGFAPGHDMPPTIEYVQNNSHISMGHGMPGGPPPQMYNGPGGPGRPFHHNAPPPPMDGAPAGRPVDLGLSTMGGPSRFVGHRNGRRSPSPPPGPGYGHGGMNGVGPYGGPGGPGSQNGVVAGPSGLKQQQQQMHGGSGPGGGVNGWSKEPRERERSDRRERDRERERKIDRDRERERERPLERDREPNWPPPQEEDPRAHVIHRHNSHLQQQQSQGQGVAHHHHHVVHHHHHASPSSSSTSLTGSRASHHHSHPHTHQHQHQHSLGSSRRHDLERAPIPGHDLESVANGSSGSSGRRHVHGHPHGHNHVHIHREGSHVHSHGHGRGGGLVDDDIPKPRRPTQPPFPQEMDIGPGSSSVWREREISDDFDREMRASPFVDKGIMSDDERTPHVRAPFPPRGSQWQFQPSSRRQPGTGPGTPQEEGPSGSYQSQPTTGPGLSRRSIQIPLRHHSSSTASQKSSIPTPRRYRDSSRLDVDEMLSSTEDTREQHMFMERAPERDHRRRERDDSNYSRRQKVEVGVTGTTMRSPGVVDAPSRFPAFPPPSSAMLNDLPHSAGGGGS